MAFGFVRAAYEQPLHQPPLSARTCVSVATRHTGFSKIFLRVTFRRFGALRHAWK
jgi:hypothetical protein